MDTTEKVLNGLIDAMHKHIAKGNGEKKVSVATEIAKVTEVEPIKEVKKSEPSLFDKFLQQAKDNRPKPKGTEMTFSTKKNLQKKKK